MIKPKKLTVFKNDQFVATYKIGDEIYYEGKESGKRVTDISVGFFGRVRIDLNDGSKIYFQNTTIEYEV